MSKTEWIDFKEIKSRVSMPDVLQHYGITLRKVNTSSLRGNCPLPSHPEDGSQESFHASTAKNVFKCHSERCRLGSWVRAQGNVLDFVSAMENVPVAEAAAKLAQVFNLDRKKVSREGKPPERPRRAAPSKPDDAAPVGEPSEAVAEGPINPPLKFELKVAVGEPKEFLERRGLSEDTCERFGAGLCLSKSKLFAGRFVVPLHNPQGRLVGYIGRSVDDSEPKYILPPSERGFSKTQLLFNYHCVAHEPAIIVVEGPLTAMKLDQSGFKHVVATFGTFISDVQMKLLASFKHVYVLFDGDKAGQDGARKAVLLLAPDTFVRTLELPEGAKPDEVDPAKLRELIDGTPA